MDTQTATTNATYLKTLDIAKQYLGPAAERFINRQIEQHLNTKPEDISKQDIPELAKWVKTSAALLTDQKIASDFADKISALT
jgi:hypothetical protein